MGRSLPVLPQSGLEGAASSSSPPPQRKDAARNRKKILEAARKLMKSRGLDVICMDELAAAAGVGKGTLYRRVTDTFALFSALLDDDEVLLQERARARFGLPKDAAPQQRLLVTWAAFVDFVIDNADVLAAAETEVRSRAALCDSAPYHWRHVELVRHLCACHIEPLRASLMADAWLLTLAADVVRRAIARSSIEDVRAAWRSLPAGLPLTFAGEVPT